MGNMVKSPISWSQGKSKPMRRGKSEEGKWPEFDRKEFDEYLIKDDDLTLTSCCNRKYYKTKDNFKCPGCKKVVTKDIVGRGIMKGIDQMMVEKEKEEIKKEE